MAPGQHSRGLHAARCGAVPCGSPCRRTGIHSEGWTEERAVAYLIDTGRQEPDLARAEVRRYITLPGQATGYKIGMLKIMELRRHAEQVLGARFDVRAFHDMVVSGGSMPLPVLEARVENWISAAP